MGEYKPTKNEYNRLSSIKRDYLIIKESLIDRIEQGKEIDKNMLKGYFELKDNYLKEKINAEQQRKTISHEDNRTKTGLQEKLDKAA